jgi:hypothetical protein
MRKRLQAKLKAIKKSLRDRLHEPLKEMGRWLKRVLSGHYQYYGVPRNMQALMNLRH